MGRSGYRIAISPATLRNPRAAAAIHGFPTTGPRRDRSPPGNPGDRAGGRCRTRAQLRDPQADPAAAGGGAQRLAQPRAARGQRRGQRDRLRGAGSRGAGRTGHRTGPRSGVVGRTRAAARADRRSGAAVAAAQCCPVAERLGSSSALVSRGQRHAADQRGTLDLAAAWRIAVVAAVGRGLARLSQFWQPDPGSGLVAAGLAGSAGAARFGTICGSMARQRGAGCGFTVPVGQRQSGGLSGAGSGPGPALCPRAGAALGADRRAGRRRRAGFVDPVLAPRFHRGTQRPAARRLVGDQRSASAGGCARQPRQPQSLALADRLWSRFTGSGACQPFAGRPGAAGSTGSRASAAGRSVPVAGPAWGAGGDRRAGLAGSALA